MILLVAALVLSSCSAKKGVSGSEPRVVCPPGSSGQVSLAAREVRRYFYVRTGVLLPLGDEMSPSAASQGPGGGGETILVGVKGEPMLTNAADAATATAIAELQPQQYLLKTIPGKGGKVLLIAGGDGAGALYGAYRLAERLGMGFYLHGDVMPDRRIAPALPDLDEIGKPLFDIRGINPFHDFPEGPDWWSTDDYEAYISQLAKMRMNFIGLHCYPAGAGPEPAVWIGVAGDCDEKGRVKFAYPSAWDSTARSGWGSLPMKTGDFAAGASLLFEKDTFGSPAMEGMTPWPRNAEESCAVFNNAGEMFNQAFTHARRLGVKTCIGTETPMWVPDAVRERLKKQGKDASSPAVVQEIYEGMFRRIAKAHPLDYYWLWTPEGWTWGGNLPQQWQATAGDLKSAQAALDAIGKPFTLATCGWVLGPQEDRAAMDKVLPKDSPISCINRQVGHDPIDPGFAKIGPRPKWAIPWMENDPSLLAPQPWAGRMRYDAAAAKSLGCTGLIGIHWRTKILAPNISALATAAWDQSWAKTIPAPATQASEFRQTVGAIAQFTEPVAGTNDVPVYQSVRYGLAVYDLAVPNGTYTVTLKFNEPFYGQAGKRVFGVMIQGKRVIDSIDIFARVGKNKALDLSFGEVKVTDGVLKIDFIPQTEFPCIAGVAVEGTADPANQEPSKHYVRKINIGGGKYKDYEADAVPQGHVTGDRERTMSVLDLYENFARVNFGDEAAKAAGAILAQIDGVHFPEPASWGTGPGNINIVRQPWEQIKGQYHFVDELAAVRPSVKGLSPFCAVCKMGTVPKLPAQGTVPIFGNGPEKGDSPSGNLERFDYWLNTFRFTAAMAQAGCCRGALDQTMEAVAAQKDPDKKKELAAKALALRVDLTRIWEKMLTFQLAATDTPGEMGTVSNIERHNRVGANFLTAHDVALAAALGQPLPQSTQLSSSYAGPARLIVPTVRTEVVAGESLKLRLIVLDNRPAKSVTLYWRPMGKGQFQPVEVKHLGRAVYQAALPPATEDFEYYIQAQTVQGKTLVWPAEAPKISQTVVVSP